MMDISAGNTTLFTPHIRFNTTDIMQIWKSDPGFWINSAAGFALFGFGLPLNTWVLWLIQGDTGGRVSSDIFAVNLVAMEVYYCMVSPYVWFSIHFSIKPLLLFGTFSDGLVIAGQPLFQCCICVERYLAVVYPITFLKYKPVRYRLTWSSAVWLLAIVYGGISLYQFPYLSYYPFCLICFCLLALSVFSSVAILKVLSQSGPGEGEREEMNLMKRKAFTTVLVILVMTVVNYFPFLITGIVASQGLISKEYLYTTYSISYCILMSGSIVQPLLYLARAEKLPCLRWVWN